ncbi:MAG: cytochrome c oxidase subunit II [Candidatus Kapabacteria bacterium]|nr:cytochrome c oxidase subunit II [Candidatus Kapabacteria bacterium]MDW8012011.1 cytochrome c oxidase subunit II [Bacteroidota bacterium]
MPQSTILLLFSLGALVIAGVFWWVWRSSYQPASVSVEPLRRWIFVGLLLFVGAFTALTLWRMPYFLYAEELPERVIHVVSRQFAFALSERPIETDAEYAAALGQTLELPLGKVVEFRVTSFDVNHGFALYSPDRRIVAQVQAMPGYINRPRWRFDQPGEYVAQCLEYCGAAHANMQARFVVQ